MSEEHVIPRWVSKILAEDRRHSGRPQVQRMVDRQGHLVRELPPSKLINVVTRRVCKVCNEGWMERKLERPCQPILGPMIRGWDKTLDQSEQAVLAGWAAKVAMVMAYIHAPPQPVKREWLDWMYWHQRPPANWYVWMASCNGQRPTYFSSDAGAHASLPSGPMVDVYAQAATLIIGYAALKILGPTSVVRVEEPGRDAVIRLWPLTGETTVRWPPPRHIDDRRLPLFVDMFLDPGQPPRPLS